MAAALADFVAASAVAVLVVLGFFTFGPIFSAAGEVLRLRWFSKGSGGGDGLESDLLLVFVLLVASSKTEDLRLPESLAWLPSVVARDVTAEAADLSCCTDCAR